MGATIWPSAVREHIIIISRLPPTTSVSTTKQAQNYFGWPSLFTYGRGLWYRFHRRQINKTTTCSAVSNLTNNWLRIGWSWSRVFFVECLYFSLRMRMNLAVKTQYLVKNIALWWWIYLGRWILLLLCSIFLSTPKQRTNIDNICADCWECSLIFVTAATATCEKNLVDINIRST